MANMVSVVLCTFNDEKYIAQTIESVLSQTFPDFEFIIWDDGSTDNTANIIKNYHDKRIKYFFHENTGLGEALHFACSEASGKYIARIDGDDVCNPNRFEVEVDYLEKHPDYVLVSSAVEYIDKNGNKTGRYFPCTNDTILKRSLKRVSLIVHPMVMMRRDAYLKAGGYPKIRQFEDVVFWNKLSKHGKFKNLTQSLGLYRLLGSSISHIYNPYERVLSELRLKMIDDESILQSDIDLYNQIITYSKTFCKSLEDKDTNRSRKYDEMLFNTLKHIMSDNMASSLVCSLKNLFLRLKY